jgi:hypothetical protein
MNWLLVVVHNFNLVRVVVFPEEANTPLVIDPDTVLPPSAADQCLKKVAWWHSQRRQLRRSMQLQQFSAGHTLYVLEPGHCLALEESPGVGVTK